MWLVELCSTNPLRIPHPKIDKFACQAQGGGIFAAGEITFRKYDATQLHHTYRGIFAVGENNIP